MTADAPGRVGRRTGATGTFGTAAIRRRLAANRDFGPFDAEDLDPSLPGPPGLLDFGSVRVPVPPEGTVTVRPVDGGGPGRLKLTARPTLPVDLSTGEGFAGLWAERVSGPGGAAPGPRRPLRGRRPVDPAGRAVPAAAMGPGSADDRPAGSRRRGHGGG